MRLVLLCVAAVILLIYDGWLVATGSYQPLFIAGLIGWIAVLYYFSLGRRRNGHKSGQG